MLNSLSVKIPALCKDATCSISSIIVFADSYDTEFEELFIMGCVIGSDIGSMKLFLQVQ